MYANIRIYMLIIGNAQVFLLLPELTTGQFLEYLWLVVIFHTYMSSRIIIELTNVCKYKNLYVNNAQIDYNINFAGRILQYVDLLF
jgi:hypothetical protein